MAVLIGYSKRVLVHGEGRKSDTFVVHPSLLGFFTLAKKNTFGWDEINMDFSVQDCVSSIPASESSTGVEKKFCTLSYTYSWVVLNGLVSAIDKRLVRQSMIDDQVAAINKLAALCESKGSSRVA